MKKYLILPLVLVFSVSLAYSGIGCKEEKEPAKEVTEEAAEEAEPAEEAAEEAEPAEEAAEEKEPVTIYFATWQAEYDEQYDAIFGEFEELYPYITVDASYITGTEYDVWVSSSMELGEGCDIYQLRSFDISRALYDAGYLMELDEELIPNLPKFDDSYISAWRTEDGIIYGIPYMASSHGIFYNTEIFNEYNLSVPETWEELISICDTLQSNGITPFISGCLGAWVFWATWYPGIVPSFYGGEDTRQKLMAGEMKFTDEPLVKAFEALEELGKYHNKDFMSLDYMEGFYSFLAGEGAMLIDGGWMETNFGDEEFEVGWFGPPVVNKGDTPWFCFHIDTGVGINKDTKHPEEALLLAEWMSTEDFGKAFMNNINGAYVVTPGNYEGTGSPLMKQTLEFKAKSKLTIRIMQEKLNAQDPSGQLLMEEAFIGMYSEGKTPYEAAEIIQEGLASWYEPLMD